jgi:hypothetical protein
MARLATASAVAIILLWVCQVNAQPRYWMKTWRVDAVAYSKCPKDFGKSLIGKEVSFSDKRFDNPLYESCDGDIDYSDISETDVASLSRKFGITWRFPKLAGPEVLSGWVRCHGYNFGGFIFESEKQGYYLFEDGAVLSLR